MDLTKELQRGGVRGGRDQFNWDSVKSMSNRDRQQYLGASTKIGVGGRFGKFDRNDWWRTGKQELAQTQSTIDEKPRIPTFEEERMNRALGIRPKVQPVSQPIPKPEAVIKQEKSASIPQNATVRSNILEVGQDDNVDAVRSVSGLGFRKYLKPTDWTNVQDVEDILEGEETIELPAIKKESTETNGPRRVFGPTRPPPLPIKEEVVDDRSNDRRRDRSRSRGRY
jgi:hypothetical protein